MNIMKFRPLFLFISLSLILFSAFSIIKWKFKPSIDFLGGTVWEIKTAKNQEEIKKIFNQNKISINSISATSNHTQLLKFQNINQEIKLKVETELKSKDQQFIEVRYETLTPSLGRELLQKTIYAIILSSLAILIFIASRFNNWAFGLGAVLAMFHDTFILIGVFSFLGHLFGAEIDSLFVTAVLTTLSSSVHDTIVTFDRMRELRHKRLNLSWVELANEAVTNTLVRSINNSMTIIFMLLSLVLFGGEITRWFASALLVGVICGTYSSTAVAIPLVLLFKRSKK